VVLFTSWGKKAVRGTAFSMFSRYFIWKKTKKQTLKKSRSGNGFFTKQQKQRLLFCTFVPLVLKKQLL
jgi:hypothetical protein